VTAAQAPARRRATLVAVAVAVIVAADQATKSIAVARWSDTPRQIIGHDVELFVTRNSGSAFSRFQNLTPLLAVGATVVAFVLARAARKESDRITLYALVLLLGGALGNLTDRFVRAPSFLHGSVVDFVKVGWWPVFNVADSCVTIGAVLLIARGLVPPRETTGATGDAPSDAAAEG
jgi:signal peptidase II